MNYKVATVVVAGVLAIVILFFVPPWKAHGTYVGHFRVDRVAWLEFDARRFYVEQGIIVLVALAVGAKAWRRK